jgi:undecaprenyl diphosphate synthase
MITHLACVMDGNRRWAQAQGQPSWYGHRAGAQKVRLVIDFCLQYKISYLSLYTFSLENFKRSDQERSYLFDLVIQQAEQYTTEFIAQDVKIKFVGDLAAFPESVQKVCQRVEQQTSKGSTLQVNFLFGYGARQEIFAAAQSLVAKITEGISLVQADFEDGLWTAGTPDPDLIIRTGGVQRLSNFLLYQAAYAEIRFFDTLWPDITSDELYKAVMSAVQAQKNVGK